MGIDCEHRLMGYEWLCIGHDCPYWHIVQWLRQQNTVRHQYDDMFEQVLADHPIITDYLDRH